MNWYKCEGSSRSELNWQVWARAYCCSVPDENKEYRFTELCLLLYQKYPTHKRFRISEMMYINACMKINFKLWIIEIKLKLETFLLTFGSGHTPL